MLEDVIHVTGTGASSVEKKFPARFHGAFTGGFSAGFHNTVGSAEGWTPSTFTSSRAHRAEQKDRRAEDLMDSEDLNEAAQAGTTMRTTAQFQGATAKKSGDALGRMITPVSESIGVKMLMRMGWRHGHGVGARKSKVKVPVEKVAKKVYTVQMPPGREAEAKASVAEDEESDEAISGDDEAAIAVAKSALRVLGEAPAEVALHHKVQKADVYGIGFDPKRHGGQIERGVSDSQSARLDAIKKRQVLMGGRDTRAALGFGLSALEDSGAYDDAYSAPDMEQYDLEERDAEEERQSSKRERKLQAQQQFHEVFEFIPAKRSPAVEQVYPPIEVPASFNEMHKATVDDLKIGGLSLSEDVRSLASLYEASNLAMTPDHRIVRLSGVAASTRGAILGARQLKSGPAPPPTVALSGGDNGRSVFEGVSVSDKQRLADSLFGNFASSSEGAETYNADWQSQLEAKGATLFPGDLEKQKRFGLFLGYYQKKMQLGDAAGAFFDVVKSAKVTGSSTTSQLLREQEEFNALVKKHEPKGFKGSNQMVPATPSDPFANRFSSGGVIAPSSVSGFDTLMTAISGPTLQSVRAAAGESKDIATAANLEMFGKMTRTRSEWRPAPLLCRRFGVRDPFEGKEDAKKTQSKSDVALESLRATVMSSFQTPNPTPWFASNSETSSQQAAEAAVAGLLFEDNEVTADLPEGVEEVKPPVDLYKAIFQDDDDEEEATPAADLQIEPTPTAEMKANPGPPPGLPPGSQAEQQAVFEEQTRLQIQAARERAASVAQQLAAEKNVHPSRLAQMAPVLKSITPAVSVIHSVNKHAAGEKEPLKKEEEEAKHEREERRGGKNSSRSNSRSRRRSKKESRSRSRDRKKRKSSRSRERERSRSRNRERKKRSSSRSRDRERRRSRSKERRSKSRSRRRRDSRSRSKKKNEEKRSQSEEKKAANERDAENAAIALALAPAADKLSLKRLEQITQEQEQQEAALEQARSAALKSIKPRQQNSTTDNHIDTDNTTQPENFSYSKLFTSFTSTTTPTNTYSSMPSSSSSMPSSSAALLSDNLNKVTIKREPTDSDSSEAERKRSARVKQEKSRLPSSSSSSSLIDEELQVLDKSVFKVKPKPEQTVEVLSSGEDEEEEKSSKTNKKEHKKKQEKEKEPKKKKEKKKKASKDNNEEEETDKQSKKKKEKKQSRKGGSDNEKANGEKEEEDAKRKRKKKKKKKTHKKGESGSDSEEPNSIDKKLEMSKQLLDKLKATLAKQKEKKHKKKKSKDQDPRKPKHKR